MQRSRVKLSAGWRRSVGCRPPLPLAANNAHHTPLLLFPPPSSTIVVTVSAAPTPMPTPPTPAPTPSRRHRSRGILSNEPRPSNHGPGNVLGAPWSIEFSRVGQAMPLSSHLIVPIRIHSLTLPQHIVSYSFSFSSSGSPKLLKRNDSRCISDRIWTANVRPAMR